MAELILDGNEPESRSGSTPNPYSPQGYRAFPINPGTGLATRVGQVSECAAFYNVPGNGNHGDILMQGGTNVVSWSIDGNGTPVIWRGNPFSGGVVLATGPFGSCPTSQFVYVRFDVELAPGGVVGNGTADLWVNGALKVSFVGALGGGGETYVDGFRLNSGTLSSRSDIALQHTMPDGRHGDWSFDTSVGGFGDAYRDDIFVCAPSLLFSVVAGTVAAGDLLTGPTGTILVDDYDTAGSFQGGGFARVWGHTVTGTFANGDAVTGPGPFAGTALVGTGFTAQGLEANAQGPLNLFVLPFIPTADNVVNLTPSAGANWQVAAQRPPGPSYNENATAGTLADDYGGTASVLTTDTIFALAICADVQAGGGPIVNGYVTWTDNVPGTNQGNTQPLPGGSYNQLVSVWGTRSDLSAIPASDIIAATIIGVGLAT